MTVDEAQALARQIAKVLQQADASFLLAVEYDIDEERTRAVWHAGGNNTSMANMAGILLEGVTKASKPDGCDRCDAALASMERAATLLCAGGAASCH